MEGEQTAVKADMAETSCAPPHPPPQPPMLLGTGRCGKFCPPDTNDFDVSSHKDGKTILTFGGSSWETDSTERERLCGGGGD